MNVDAYGLFSVLSPFPQSLKMNTCSDIRHLHSAWVIIAATVFGGCVSNHLCFTGCVWSWQHLSDFFHICNYFQSHIVKSALDKISLGGGYSILNFLHIGSVCIFLPCYFVTYFLCSLKLMTCIFLCSLWELCNSEHSHICQVCVPLLLHCITLPSGSDMFWKVIQEEFHNTDWRYRFVAGMCNVESDLWCYCSLYVDVSKNKNCCYAYT